VRGTVLIIDDNVEILELLRRVVEKEGYRTILEKDGERGLASARQHVPDIIVLERLLPNLNGLQICRRLKERPETQRIPLIFLSVLDSEQDIVDGLKTGADDYIKKPFSPDELLARIERVLSRTKGYRT
jgi:two-component system phosphate regulon response regulator PhoB